MHKKRLTLAAVIIVSAVFLLSSASVWASSTLKKEMQGDEVTALQKDLKKLGYMSVDASGLYGDITEEAVKELQKEYGYEPDGVAGDTTFSLIDRLLGRNLDTKAAADTSTNSSAVLKEEMESSAVTALQKDLIKLGFLSTEPTGYFGEATAAAVKKMQSKYGYEPDGMVGSSTLSLIKKLINDSGSKTASKEVTKTKVKTETKTEPKTEPKKQDSDAKQTNYLLPWFNTVSETFGLGDTATVYDIDSGLSFKVKRTYGHNHADCEALTASDTATMKKIFGGEWSWTRRAVIITVKGEKIAASIAGMPHAGSDKYAANKYISSRSGGYGRGENLDTVKGNNMNGHFDIHFYGSKTHDTNRVDSAHQKMVKKAAEWAKENL
jgi:peptidoglycan hydrolase-like protein with peptidoglycan-binding domain